MFIAAAWPLILTQHNRERGRADQVSYHQPCLLKIAEELPYPDFSDYLTATTPGYHVVMAVVARYVSDSTVVLQLVSSLFTVVLLAIFVRWLTPRAGPWIAISIGAGLMASPYVFSSGVFLLPDNTAWLMVMLILVLANRFRIGPWFYVVSALAYAMLVMTRQSHAWAAGVIWAAAWIGPRHESFAEATGSTGLVSLFSNLRVRFGRLALGVAATLPGLLLLWWFYRLWGGITPPIYQGFMQGVNPATPPFIALQIGMIGVYYVGYWGPPLVDVLRRRWWLGVGIVTAGLVLATVPETTFNPEAGRRTGVWNLIGVLPVWADRTSVAMLVGVPLGLFAVAGWAASMPKRSRWLFVGALVAFTTAMSVTTNSWTRYHQPMLLIFSGIATAMVAQRGFVKPGKGRMVLVRTYGPICLVISLALITVLQNTRGPRIYVHGEHPGAARPLPELWPSDWKVNGPPEGLVRPDGEEEVR